MQYKHSQMASSTLRSTSINSFPGLFTILALLFISTLHTALAANSTQTTSTSLKTYKTFIKDTCNTTTYPKDCYKYLSPFASKIKTSPLVLTRTAVSVALNAARNAFSTLTKLGKLKGLTHAESEVIGDCLENIDDTVDSIKKSQNAIARLNGTSTLNDLFQWSNIKTWMSAAITDESTCTDEFDEMQVRTTLQKKIKTSVSNLARLTSNALSLVNKISY